MNDWSTLLGLPLWFWIFILPALLAVACFAAPAHAGRVLRPVWRVLDGVYLAAGIIAAGFMITILTIIVVQMVARWSGLSFEGATEYAGYAMAATSFFAAAHTLTRGAHIRVSILLNLNDFTRFWLDALALLIAAITATYFARFAIKTNFLSELLNDRTQGQDMVPQTLITFLQTLTTPPWQWGALWENAGAADGAWVHTPIWIPQLPMSVGTCLLAIALWDYLTRLLVTGKSSIKGEVLG